ncbi:MAG: prolyl-tRNA synthetase associated domain-containing protein [Butyrivibrio sp.]|nr:prolyl-tRNA synthetase associated domain-containing protein [Muribaculum sp.]MCM1553743.1 prolyl-tRNA synthetase associated domain-containing protein [Butyrivibrio sp.]
MLELKIGRPADCGGRLEKEIRTYDFLDQLGIEYRRIDHAAAMTMEVCEEIDKALQATICKNLFLCNRQETDFYLLMMPGDKRFKTKDLSKELGVSRLSFANESYMEQYLDITPGSVSVMGLMNDKANKVRLVIDEEVLRGTEIGCHPCINTSSIKFATRDLTEKLLPAMKHDYTVVTLPRYEEE